MDDILDPILAAREPRKIENVQYLLDDGVARIRFKRPEAANALNLAVLEDLIHALEQLELKEAAKVVVIQGDDRAFSSGLDIAEHTEDSVYQLLDAFHRTIRRLVDLGAVSFSVVKGMALGAGCELAAACDFCFAADNAKLGQPELKAGLFPSVAPVIYPRLLGLHRTFELILTGRIYDGREAESIGLVTRSFASDKLDLEVEKWIQFLKGFSTPVLRLARRAISDAANLPLEDGLRHLETIYLDQLMATEDAAEGLRALRERRPPVWKHR
ncbi:MAG TPA: enoyl-CoA hydratase/isomerase family protein [Vicinamibacteria bacterium]|nr:enoyl-CoA hydratase/isomerase family protein [Vicinamibacteria bacterium]